jgi:hypothetical protein
MAGKKQETNLDDVPITGPLKDDKVFTGWVSSNERDNFKVGDQLGYGSGTVPVITCKPNPMIVVSKRDARSDFKRDFLSIYLSADGLIEGGNDRKFVHRVETWGDVMEWESSDGVKMAAGKFSRILWTVDSNSAYEAAVSAVESDVLAVAKKGWDTLMSQQRAASKARKEWITRGRPAMDGQAIYAVKPFAKVAGEMKTLVEALSFTARIDSENGGYRSGPQHTLRQLLESFFPKSRDGEFQAAGTKIRQKIASLLEKELMKLKPKA